MNEFQVPIILEVINLIRENKLSENEVKIYQALEGDKKNVNYLFQIGLSCAQNNRFSDALLIFNCLLSKNVKDLKIYYNLGLIYSLRGNHSRAVSFYVLALEIKSADFETRIHKGASCNDLKKYSLALEAIELAIEISPDIPEAWSNKGISLSGLGFYTDAIEAYNKAIELNLEYAEAWSNRSIPLYKLGQYAEAYESCERALMLRPNYDMALKNKAVILHQLKRYDEAIVHYDKALSLNPDFAEAHSNKANALNELKRYDEAIAHYDKALSLNPDYHEAWTNKGATLYELKRYDEAIAHFDKSLSLKPDYHEATWNKSLSYLLQGNFEKGLPLYESRRESEIIDKVVGKRVFNQPTWNGLESLDGKTILLYGEQGFGDFIQFCRYVKLVSELGARVILETPKPLYGLMTGLPGVTQLVIEGDPLQPFDYQCSLLSLPLALKTNLTNIPTKKSYLVSDPDKVLDWAKKLGKKRGMRVGLAWSSISNFSDDSKRSLELVNFVKALPIQGCEYVCLQKELKECDVEFFQNYKNIQFFGNELKDFSDTAALCEHMDIVISVDTSVAHLAAAIGKSTWILLPYVPDWRWLLDRKDSPWYPSVKLYRQATIDDWDQAFENVRNDLISIS